MKDRRKIKCPRCGSDEPIYILGNDPCGVKTCGVCSNKFYGGYFEYSPCQYHGETGDLRAAERNSLDRIVEELQKLNERVEAIESKLRGE